MTSNWAIEVRNKSGFMVFGRRVATADEIEDVIGEMLASEQCGGVVIYRSTVPDSNDCETDEECLASKTLGITPHVCLLRPGHEGDHQWTAERPIGYSENLEKVAAGNYEDVRGERPYPYLGGCKTCGCPPEKMPMVNRGTGWCSEAHRKEQLKLT